MAIAQLSDERVDELLQACEEFRDGVLNRRHQLEEPCLDSDQTNAVLGLFDDTIGNAMDAMRHIHVNAGDGTDTCKRCGRDLRNMIHLRHGERA